MSFYNLNRFFRCVYFKRIPKIVYYVINSINFINNSKKFNKKKQTRRIPAPVAPVAPTALVATAAATAPSALVASTAVPLCTVSGCTNPRERSVVPGAYKIKCSSCSDDARTIETNRFRSKNDKTLDREERDALLRQTKMEVYAKQRERDDLFARFNSLRNSTVALHAEYKSCQERIANAVGASAELAANNPVSAADAYVLQRLEEIHALMAGYLADERDALARGGIALNEAIKNVRASVSSACEAIEKQGTYTRRDPLREHEKDLLQKALQSAADNIGPPPLCLRCGSQPSTVTFSPIRYTQHCVECTDIRKDIRNKSYYGSKKSKKIDIALDAHLERIREQYYMADRRCGDLRADLEEELRARDALQESLDVCRAQEGEISAGKFPASTRGAASIRCEAFMVQVLASMSDKLRSRTSDSKSQVCNLITSMGEYTQVCEELAVSLKQNRTRFR